MTHTPMSRDQTTRSSRSARRSQDGQRHRSRFQLVGCSLNGTRCDCIDSVASRLSVCGMRRPHCTSWRRLRVICCDSLNIEDRRRVRRRCCEHEGDGARRLLSVDSVTNECGRSLLTTDHRNFFSRRLLRPQCYGSRVIKELVLPRVVRSGRLLNSRSW